MNPRTKPFLSCMAKVSNCSVSNGLPTIFYKKKIYTPAPTLQIPSLYACIVDKVTLTALPNKLSINYCN